MAYTIEEHKHRFAAWAAGRAATVKGFRFTVEQAKVMIEKAELNLLIEDPEKLPPPDKIDIQHRAWRNNIIKTAEFDFRLSITHGVAAKLINIYLKAALVCGGHHENMRVKALHPPIDSVLLKALSVDNFGEMGLSWRKAQLIRWSKFNSDQYEEVIHKIRMSIPDNNMWKIERHWKGFQ